MRKITIKSDKYEGITNNCWDHFDEEHYEYYLLMKKIKNKNEEYARQLRLIRQNKFKNN